MVLGQSAGTAAVVSVDANAAVQDLDLPALEKRLVADGQILKWDPSLARETVAPLIPPDALPGIVLDDADAEKAGEWLPSSMASSRRVGTGYVHDGDAEKGRKRITYRPNLPHAGRYQVNLIYVPNENRASRVPVTIGARGVDIATVYVDMKNNDSNGFASLGIFELPEGTDTKVIVSTEGTDGYVVADGLQILPN
jgi:hypothetical protein